MRQVRHAHSQGRRALEQGRAEPGHPAYRALGTWPRRRRAPRPRSGRRYETPVNVFPAGDGYVLALTYGPDTDWVKNVLAAGGCELRTRGHTTRLVSPRLVHDETRQAIRPFERQVLRALNVADFLTLTVAPAVPPGPPDAA